MHSDNGWDGSNGFMSKMAEKLWGATDEFNGVNFHFHSGSEHTVNGERMDLEMHTVHTAKETKGGIGLAAVGIMFSVEQYTAELSWAEKKIIDRFFDQMTWRDVSPVADGAGDRAVVDVDMIAYGDLMTVVDSNQRWIYKGSVTTPPCAQYVYWNVLSTVYPISQKHLDLFKAQLNFGENGELDTLGNWRMIQEENDHEVAYIGAMDEAADPYQEGLIAGIVVLAVVSFLLFIGTIGIWIARDKQVDEDKDGEIEMDGGEIDSARKPITERI